MKQKELSNQNKIILFIDATNKEAVISINHHSGRAIGKIIIENNRLSETMLISVLNLCERYFLKLTDISAVYINPGPGSYTGLRISVTTANLLAYSLNIPIYATNSDELKFNQIDEHFIAPILPIYAKPPHITTPKPRLK